MSYDEPRAKTTKEDLLQYIEMQRAYGETLEDVY